MSNFDTKVYRATLDNGLRVVCMPQPALHTAAVCLHLSAGSRFETPENSGCSHFVEHMLFRGVPRHPSARLQALAFEQLGGTLYAETRTESGLMSLTLPPENLHSALEIFAEVALEPLMSDIEIERGIIREEVLETLDDDGRLIDPDHLLRALAYPGHALGRSITGSIELIDNFGLSALRDHHARFYVGDGIVLSFAGAIDPDRCLRDAERLMSRARKAGVPAVEPAPELPDRAQFQYVHHPMSQTDVRLGFRAPGLTDTWEPATELVLRVLDDGMSTRLYSRICDEKGLCYEVSANYEPFLDDGIFDIAVVVQHSRAPLVVGEVFQLLDELVTEGPTEAELIKAKARHRWETEAFVDQSEALASFYGFSALANGPESPIARHEQIETVTLEQVHEAARRLFNPRRLSAVAVGMLDSASRRKIENAVDGFGDRCGTAC